MIRDTVGILGFAAIVAGATNRFGWDVAAIIAGTLMLAVAITGAIRK